MGKRGNLKTRKTENDVINTFIRIQLTGLSAYVLIFTLFCIIGLSADIKRSYDMILSLAAFSLGSFLTALTAGLKIREKGLLVGAIYTLPLNTLVILISLFFCNFAVDFRLLITVLILILSGAIGGVTGVNFRFRR